MMRYTSFGLTDASDGLGALDSGRHAARVHDNVVRQPGGPALMVFANGPVSVCNNRFSAQITGPSSFDRLAGAVLLMNLGSGVQTSAPTGLFAAAITRPGGETLFSANQTWLGLQSESFASQIIFTLDDLGFDGEQSNTLGRRTFLNTWLAGRTVRATDSRFKEPVSGGGHAIRVSLLTVSMLLNNTNDNHADHCIFARNAAPGRPPNVAGNQVVDATFCPVVDRHIFGPVGDFAVNATFGRD